MIEWVLLGAATLAAGGWVVRRVGKGRVHGDWSERLQEVADRVDGRASPATADDHPQLRAEVRGLTITLELIDIHAGSRGRVQAQVPLPDPNNTCRLYLGWDMLKTPKDVMHMPSVPPGPTRLEGQVELRADDGTFAERVLNKAALQLMDLRREGQGRAVELVVRGGNLTLVVHGLEPTTSILERSLKVTADLAHLAHEASQGTQLGAGDSDPSTPTPDEPGPALPAGELKCELCGEEHQAGEAWVVCAACGAPYHAACFQQATACLVAGCGSTRSQPLAGTP